MIDRNVRDMTQNQREEYFLERMEAIKEATENLESLIEYKIYRFFDWFSSNVPGRVDEVDEGVMGTFANQAWEKFIATEQYKAVIEDYYEFSREANQYTHAEPFDY
jgi:hypothetical protein